MRSACASTQQARPAAAPSSAKSVASSSSTLTAHGSSASSSPLALRVAPPAVLPAPPSAARPWRNGLLKLLQDDRPPTQAEPNRPHASARAAEAHAPEGHGRRRQPGAEDRPGQGTNGPGAERLRAAQQVLSAAAVCGVPRRTCSHRARCAPRASRTASSSARTPRADSATGGICPLPSASSRRSTCAAPPLRPLQPGQRDQPRQACPLPPWVAERLHRTRAAAIGAGRPGRAWRVLVVPASAVCSTAASRARSCPPGPLQRGAPHAAHSRPV